MSNSDYKRKQSRGPGNIIVEATVPRRRQDVLKINGWGFKDTSAFMKDGRGFLSTERYGSSHGGFPEFSNYFKTKFHLHIPENLTLTEFVPPNDNEYEPSRLLEKDLDVFRRFKIEATTIGIDRLVHAAGKGTEDLFLINQRPLQIRLPDAVVWPNCHEDVVHVVSIASENNWVLVPYGGGTAVSGALLLPKHESRPIISLDMGQMNEILWLNRESLTICVEAGISGLDLERSLKNIGYTVGHEPDSVEFSTLGGWVATRASGMKKNTYGNIEDLVLHTRIVTPTGVLEKGSRAPRNSAGPDFDNIVLGSEGNFGVITEVCLKIRPVPQVQRYDSVVFQNFEVAVECLRTITQKKLEPTNIRLLDNQMFEFSRALKPPPPSYTYGFLEKLKMAVLFNVLGFEKSKICAMTILYEGDEDEVAEKERSVNEIIKKYKGIHAGSENSKSGYLLTFVIAYIRDIMLECNLISESLETCVPWPSVVEMCSDVKQRFHKECYNLGVIYCNLVVRISQVYETGCCVYLYYGLFAPVCVTKVQCIHIMEDIIRDEILKHGGSASHHHGIGKARRQFYEDAVSNTGVGLLQALKQQVDPENIFGIENLHKDIARKTRAVKNTEEKIK